MQWAHQKAYEAALCRAGLFALQEQSVLCFHSQDAFQTLEKLLCSDVSALDVNRCGYGLMLNPQGGILQDALVLHTEENAFCLIIRDRDRRKVLQHMQRWLPECTAPTVPEQVVQLFAVTGPMAFSLPGLDLSPGEMLPQADVGGVRCMACHSDRPGLRGLVLAVDEAHAPALIAALAGLGVPLCAPEVLDTLLMEAGAPLYGREMDDTINPYEVGLERFVRKARAVYIGRDALVAAGEPRRGLIGLKLSQPGAAHGMNVVKRDKDVGLITSVGHSPRLGAHAAVALVEKPYRDPGRKLYAEAESGLIEAQVTPLPMEAAPLEL